MTTKAQIGTIISATHRPQDLVPAFVAELRRLGVSFETVEDVIDHELREYLKDENRADDDAWWNSEDCAHLLNETLSDALNEHAPVLCYFGAHPGDGSDFGFWPCEDLEDALMNSMDDIMPMGPMEDMPEYIMKTNDHGNVTMYRVHLVEEWSCV